MTRVLSQSPRAREGRAYRAAHPEYKEKQRRYSQRHREINREAVRESNRRTMQKTRQDPDRRGKVYFIRAASGPIKIGYTTKKPEGRRRELQAGNHEDLTLLVAVLGARSDEEALHRQFNHLLIGREWFRPGQDLLDLIETYRPKSIM